MTAKEYYKIKSQVRREYYKIKSQVRRELMKYGKAQYLDDILQEVVALKTRADASQKRKMKFRVIDAIRKVLGDTRNKYHMTFLQLGEFDIAKPFEYGYKKVKKKKENLKLVLNKTIYYKAFFGNIVKIVKGD